MFGLAAIYILNISENDCRLALSASETQHHIREVYFLLGCTVI